MMMGRVLESKPLLMRILRTTSCWRYSHTREAPILLQARRTFCNKAEDSKNVISQTGVPGHSIFRNYRRPTAFDKRILLWTGRFKKEEDIPELLSSEVIKNATNRARINICYAMMALTLLGCLAMIISGKQAAKRDETLLRMNSEKRAKWRAEMDAKLEAPAVKAQ